MAVLTGTLGMHRLATTIVSLTLWLVSTVIPLTTVSGTPAIPAATHEPANHKPEARQGQNDSGSPKTVAWHTGDQLDRFVLSPVSVSWTKAPLRDRLHEFSRTQRVAVFLDRRIDPSTHVTLSLQNRTIEQFFWALAKEHDLGVCRVGDLYYFGPKDVAAALPTMWQALERVSKNRPQQVLAWPTLTKPNDLIDQIGRAGRIEISGRPHIPHDLWAAGELPAMAAIQQVAMIGIGFETWPITNPSGRQVVLKHFQPPADGSVRYYWRSPKGVSPTKIKQRLRREFPDCKIDTGRYEVRAAGPVESLHNIKEYLVNRPVSATADSASIRFTLKTSATRIQILKAVANQTTRQLEFDLQDQQTLDERVTIECDQVDIKDLVRQVLAGTDLDSTIDKSNLKIINRQNKNRN